MRLAEVNFLVIGHWRNDVCRLVQLDLLGLAEATGMRFRCDGSTTVPSKLGLILHIILDPVVRSGSNLVSSAGVALARVGVFGGH